MWNLQSAVVVDELWLVEWLWLVKLHSVEGAHLIGVRVVLSSPEGTVPMLTVGRVSRGKLVTLEWSHIQGL